MTKEQIKEIQLAYPTAYELVVSDLYESWTTAELIRQLMKWMPKSEFMKLIHARDDIGEAL